MTNSYPEGDAMKTKRKLINASDDYYDNTV